jgi:hypothetical protein
MEKLMKVMEKLQVEEVKPGDRGRVLAHRARDS